MRLLRIRLRDFRGVHDREVRLAESGVTVLEGENEVGKTSTVVALDLLIDFRDDSRAAPVRSAAPSGRDAGPEVEAEFVTGPYHVVYRKRWLRRRLTELTVTGPATEQHTGREAHDRLLAILDETMDRDLWLALRVEQHTPLGQADLGGHDALTRALDRAAGGGAETVGSSADAAAEGLVERALAEVRRYHGGHGRPVGPLREAGARVTAARAEADLAAAAVSEVERDVDLRADLDRETTGLAEERRAQTDRVRELEDRWSALQARQQEVTTSAERAEAARERAARAVERQDARTRLVVAAETAELAADQADRTLAGLETGDDARREDLAERRTEADRAVAASDAATAAARGAAEALTAARDRAELADLRGRLRRAGTAEDARREAARAADGPCADAAAVERLETLDRAVVQAEAELAAGAATVEVAGLAERAVVAVDGADREITAGETTSLPVADAVTIEVPGAVRMTVRPGLDGAAARRRVADARTARDELCTTLGVADLAGARAALRAAGEAAARMRELAAVVERELGGRPLDDVRAAIGVLAERVPAESAPEPPSTRRRGPRRPAPDEPGLFEEAGLLDDASADPEPEDLEPLRLEAVRTLDAADEAHRTARAAEETWRRLDASATTAGAEVVAARTARAVARSEADRRGAELHDARAEQADEALATAATDALARARRYEADHEQRAAALEADDPTTVEALYATAKRAVESLTQRTADVERRRAEVTGRLQVAGGEGRHDRHAAALAELAAAEREHTSVSRRAAAALRLHDTLARRRDEVRRAYVAPFRREVERLARIVFGPSLVLEVDPALRIVSRTLNGVTVPFDALSTGAKEQLGLCARLAVAALVDAEDGVPVLIDDALGHSDPGRLERLAAVFGAAAAGSSHQVVVLTCTPARYRGIGAARTVTLSPSFPPPQAVPDADSGEDDAAAPDPEGFRETG